MSSGSPLDRSKPRQVGMLFSLLAAQHVHGDDLTLGPMVSNGGKRRVDPRITEFVVRGRMAHLV